MHEPNMEKLVERAFVITLAIRPDRRRDFFERLPSVDWLPEVEPWDAIHGDTCQPPPNWTAGNGAWGCLKSHLAILERCLMDRVGSYIVFEDDAQFADDFDSRGQRFLEALPDGWQQAYLGGQLQHERTHPPIKITNDIYRPYNVNRTHCFAVSREGMLPIYQHCSDLPYERHFHIDHHLGRWHEDARNQVYCPPRWIVGQHGARSNVSGKMEQVTFFEPPAKFAKDHWLFQQPTCVVFRANRSIADQCRDFLHFGNQINGKGFDVTLEEAARLRKPERAIAGWFNWIRTEITNDPLLIRIPAMMHPEISSEDVARAIPGCKLIEIDNAANAADVRRQINDGGIQL